MALAVPAFFAACADDELISTSQGHGPEVDGQLIELGEDFAVGLTRGEVAGTKANWHYNGGSADILYSWLPTFSGTSGTAAAQEEVIGFAWRGEVGDAKVRTNYKFTLDGFLKKGETAPKTIVCDNVPLVLNGYTFPRTTTGAITVSESSGTYTMNLQEYDESSKTMVASSTYDLKYDGDYELTGAQATTIADGLLDATKLDDEDPYVRNGIFTTSNSTIFKGDYIVYFPYNPSFAEVDYLPATSPTEFTQNVLNANRTAHLAGKTFGYGVATIEKGGSMAESFATKNLSGIVDFKVKNSGATVNIQKLILVDEGEGAKGFIKQVGLDATKIAAGATGTALYVSGTEVYEPTLVLNLMKPGFDYSVSSAGSTNEYTLAALPTSLSKPVLYIMNDAGLCCRKELAQRDIPAGKGVMFDVEIKADDKFDQALAVDTKTFIERLSEAGRGSEDATINVLGNITLDPDAVVSVGGNSAALNTQFLTGSNNNRSLYIGQNITVNGTGTITIPADLGILVKVVAGKTLTIKNPVVVEGRGCCGTNPGRLVLTSPQGSNSDVAMGNIIFDGAVKNYGEMWLANNSDEKAKTTVVFNSTVLNGVDTETADENNKGVIYCAGLHTGNSVVKFNDKLTNEGIINIQPSTLDISTLKSFPYDDGNYPVTGWNHEVNSVTVSVGSIDNSGEIVVDKYTVLNVAGAVANKGDLTVNSANTNVPSEDGQLAIANGASVTNSGVVENFGVINNRGSLSNASEEADIIDHIGCQFGGNKATVSMGEYICDVEDIDVNSDGDRLGDALDSNRPTTTIRFVGNSETTGKTGVYVYDLGKYGKTSFDYDFIVATDAATSVQLIATTKDAKNTTILAPVTINGKLTVEGDDTTASKLDLSQIMLTVNDVVTVNGKMTVKPTDATAETLEALVAFTAKKDVKVNGKGTFEVAKYARTDMQGNLDIAEEATSTFNYATYTNVANTINIDGTFSRVTSSGNSTSTPARVYCGNFIEGGKANITDGLPERR